MADVTRTEASEKALTFSENLENNALLENLRNQREAKKFCDIVLHVQSKRFEAHRSVLAASSPYFESVLKNHKVTREEITIGWHDVKTFEILLDYMYTGTVLINEETIYELLKLSNHFLISKLKGYCEEYLERYMDFDNCLYVLDLSEKYNMEGLQDTALDMIRDNVTAILEKPELLDFSIKRLETFMTDPGTGCDTVPFHILMNSISAWVKKDIPRRSYEFQRLLDVINWRENQPEQILDHIRNETLYDECKLCLYLILRTLMTNDVEIGAYVDGYEDLRSEFEDYAVNAPLEFDDSDTAQTGFDFDPMSGTVLFTNSPISVEPMMMVADVKPKGRRGRRPKATIKTEPTSDTEMKSQKRKELEGSSDELTPGGRKRRIVRNKYATSEWVTDDPLPVHRPARLLMKMKQQQQQQQQAADSAQPQKPRVQKFRTSMAVAVDGDLADYITSETLEEEEDDEGRIDGEGGGNSKVFHEEVLEEEETDEEPVRTEYVIRGKKHTASLAQWREGVKCPHCIYVGHSATRLEQHLARVHEEDNTYKCRLCPFTCKWNREYYKHMKSHFDGPPYRCEDCPYTCDRIQFILSHRMRHTDERPFSCEECSFKSRTKGNLIVHMRIHTGEKPYKCQYCSRCFAMKNTLDQHLATHRDDRPYLCDTCGFTTKYQSHLLSHKRIHTGNVFHCENDGCTYFSPRRSQLAAHMRSHNSIRSHICSTCGRGFIEKSHLIRHERIHLEEKPFKCDYCDYGSTRRDKLKEHVLKHHSGNEAAGKSPYKPRKSRRPSAINVTSADEINSSEIVLVQGEDGELIQVQQSIHQITEQEMAAANLVYEYQTPGDGDGDMIQTTRVVIQPALEYSDGTQTVVVEQKGEDGEDEEGDSDAGGAEHGQHVVINYEQTEEEEEGEAILAEEQIVEEEEEKHQVIEQEEPEPEDAQGGASSSQEMGRRRKSRRSARSGEELQTFMALMSN